jgi:hypothetical protein
MTTTTERRPAGEPSDARATEKILHEHTNPTASTSTIQGWLDRIGPVYEYCVWAADLGMIDFDFVADLQLVIEEMRDEIGRARHVA